MNRRDAPALSPQEGLDPLLLGVRVVLLELIREPERNDRK